MASPNFDDLSVRFSRIIEDPVATASTDGDAFTSAFRSHCINQGIRRLLRFWAINGPEDAIREYLNTEAQSMVASVKTLSSWTGGIHAIVSAYNVTDEQLLYQEPNDFREELLSSNNVFIQAGSGQQKFIVNAAQFQLFGGTATSSVRLTYVKQHTDLSAGGSSDIAIPSQYWNDVLDAAAMYFWEQYPTQENVAKLGMKRGS